MSENSLKPADISAMLGKSSAAAVAPIEHTLERFLEVAHVKSVYGKPVQHGENLIIPAAEVFGALGFGMGSGMGVGDEAEKDQAQAEESEEKAEEEPKFGAAIKIEGGGIGGGGGSGGGGGGRIFARPVAVIISGPDGVTVEPVVDVTKVALAFFTALGFMFGMAARMRRGPHRHE